MEFSDKNIAQLAELVDTPSPQRMVVVSHFNPDGDAIGSTLAWRRLLKGMGHEVECIVPNKYPGFLSWIEDVEKIRIFKDDPEVCAGIIAEADVLFFLDLNNVSRLEEMSACFETNTIASTRSSICGALHIISG